MHVPMVSVQHVSYENIAFWRRQSNHMKCILNNTDIMYASLYVEKAKWITVDTVSDKNYIKTSNTRIILTPKCATGGISVGRRFMSNDVTNN